MMTNVKRIVGATMVIPSALLLTGCFFTSTAEVISIPGEGVLAVSINFGGNWLSCLPSSTPGNTQDFNCSYFQPGNISQFSLSSVELLVRAFIIDPLVIQVPTTVSGVRGTFAHAAGTGNLVVQGPLASVPIDFTRNLTAEPGTSLHIVSVPEAFENANPTGNYTFTLRLNAPLGTTSIPVKAVLTGHARAQSGQNYYFPVFPCVTSMAAAPGGTIEHGAADEHVHLAPSIGDSRLRRRALQLWAGHCSDAAALGAGGARVPARGRGSSPETLGGPIAAAHSDVATGSASSIALVGRSFSPCA